MINDERKRKRLLVVAYAFSSQLGSEYRSAWELVQQFSKTYDVTVLLGDSDGVMGCFENIDKYVRENSPPFKIVKVHPSKLGKLMALLTFYKPLDLLFFILLRGWMKRAFKIACELHAKQPFDVAHQLGPIGFRNPGYLWKLDCTTYWGPIGGAQYISLHMIKKKLSFYFLEAMLRNVSVWVQSHSSYIKMAALNYGALSFATLENQRYFLQNFERRGKIISDQGLHINQIDNIESRDGEVLRVAWAGSLTARKNVDALIDIVKGSGENVHFTVMGDGNRVSDIRLLEQSYGNITFLGRVERAKVFEVLKGSQIILLTSLSEANTAILLEAIECNCVPVVPAINGFPSLLGEDYPYLIPQVTYEKMVSDCGIVLEKLKNERELTSARLLMNIKRKHMTWTHLAKKHIESHSYHSY